MQLTIVPVKTYTKSKKEGGLPLSTFCYSKEEASAGKKPIDKYFEKIHGDLDKYFRNIEKKAMNNSASYLSIEHSHSLDNLREEMLARHAEAEKNAINNPSTFTIGNNKSQKIFRMEGSFIRPKDNLVTEGSFSFSPKKKNIFSGFISMVLGKKPKEDEAMIFVNSAQFKGPANVNGTVIATKRFEANDAYTGKKIMSSEDTYLLGNTTVGEIKSNGDVAIENSLGYKIVSHSGDVTLNHLNGDTLDITIPGKPQGAGGNIPKITINSPEIKPKKVNVFLGNLTGLELHLENPELYNKFNFFKAGYNKKHPEAIPKATLKNIIRVISTRKV